MKRGKCRRGVRGGVLARKVVVAGYHLLLVLVLRLRVGKQLVALMYLISSLLAEESDSKNDNELADLFSLRLSACLSC